MTKTEALKILLKIESLKELLKNNLDELNKKIWSRLSIYFEEDGNNFVIMDNNEYFLMVGDISKYDYSLESQIEFIKDVGNNLVKSFKKDDEMEYDKVYFYGHGCDEIYDTYCLKPIKRGYNDDFMIPTYRIAIDKINLTHDLINELSNNLEYYILTGYDDNFIYVNVDIDETTLDINYKDNNKIIKYPVTFYYSVFDEKEAEKTVNYIEELINKRRSK